jgi:hypothetical protein
MLAKESFTDRFLAPFVLIAAVLAVIAGGSNLPDALASASNSSQGIVSFSAAVLLLAFGFFWGRYQSSQPEEETKKIEFMDLGDFCALISLLFFALAFALGTAWSVLYHYGVAQYYGLLYIAMGAFALFAVAAGTGALYRFMHPR